MFYNQKTLVSRFTPIDVTFHSLLDTLGGQELLELMINARDFRPMYSHQQQGLVFSYEVPYDCAPRLAKFYPLAMGFPEALSTIPGPPMYQVRLVIEKMFGDNTYGMEKPYHCVTVSKPNNLVHVFETVAKVTLSFTPSPTPTSVYFGVSDHI